MKEEIKMNIPKEYQEAVLGVADEVTAAVIDVLNNHPMMNIVEKSMVIDFGMAGAINSLCETTGADFKRAIKGAISAFELMIDDKK